MVWGGAAKPGSGRLPASDSSPPATAAPTPRLARRESVRSGRSHSSAPEARVRATELGRRAPRRCRRPGTTTSALPCRSANARRSRRPEHIDIGMWPREIDLLAVVIAEPLARLDSPVIGEPTFRSKALREAMNRPLVRGAHIHPRDACELLLTQSKRYQGMRGREWVFDLVVNLCWSCA
jgi:hypothetical protein